MNIHPLAELFPPLELAELQSLADDIKANGLIEPILLYEGQILDGRNRFAACELVDVKPRFHAAMAATKAPPIQKGWTERNLWDCPVCGASNVDYVTPRWCVECKKVLRVDPPEDPLKLALSRNMYRRHMTPSQLAMVAAGVATLRKGSNQHTEISVPSQAEAAKLLNVSVDAVQQARQVREHGAPELVKAVEQGEVAVSAAAKVAKAVPKAEQAKIVAGGKKEVGRIVKAADAAPKPKTPTPPAPVTRIRTKRSPIDDLLPHMHRIAGTSLADPTNLERLLVVSPEEREGYIVEAESGKAVYLPPDVGTRVELSAAEMKRLLVELSNHSARIAAAMLKEVLGDRLDRFQYLLDGLYYQGGIDDLKLALCDEDPEDAEREDDETGQSADAA